jgi:hypothetical protein
LHSGWLRCYQKDLDGDLMTAFGTGMLPERSWWGLDDGIWDGNATRNILMHWGS